MRKVCGICELCMWLWRGWGWLWGVHEKDAERDACGSGDEAKALLDVESVELTGIAAKGTAVEVEPAGWIGRWCSIQGWKSQALDSRAVILETWKWARRH